MARIIYGLNTSLDGYVDHDKFAPDPSLFQHFIEQSSRVAGSIYGRRMYEIMRYWDEPQDAWGPAEQAYAKAWCATPKYVVSRTLTSVGPNATLLKGDLEAEIRVLKESLDGELEVAGPQLAAGLGALGLIDAYQLYVHPVVVGEGSRYFFAPPPKLRLEAHERIGDTAVRLTYVPA
jgi:dihydrofolate reductase